MQSDLGTIPFFFPEKPPGAFFLSGGSLSPPPIFKPPISGVLNARDATSILKDHMPPLGRNFFFFPPSKVGDFPL